MSSPSHPEQHELLEVSDLSLDTTTRPSPTQHFAARHRPGYARVASVSFAEAVTGGMTGEAAEAERSHGLGIAIAPETTKTDHAGKESILRSPGTPKKLGFCEEVSATSTPFTGSMSGSTQYNESFSECDTSYGASKTMNKDSRISLQSTLPPSVYARSEAGLLSVRGRYDDFEPHHHCQSTTGVKRPRFSNWVPITILILAVFSTVFSGIFLVIAFRGYSLPPRGRLSPSTAAFLTSVFGKLIELSFVTVVVAFVGQALARRAFKLENARGVTIAEMSMRTWIMQPGTLLTNWESVRYAAISMLGVISLLATVAAILYTSAATALVQPQLKFSHWKSETLQGLVRTQYANPIYISDGCKTPITTMFDNDDGGKARATACNEIEHAAMAYHNYHTWLGTWSDAIHNGSGSANIDLRPIGYALHMDNTTIMAPWIEKKNVTTVNDTRWVNEVTMAMPHIGVIQAAMDPVNMLIQPGDLDGAQINIRASVPSPTINVVCLTLTQQDLKPFVYSLWDEYPPDWNYTSGAGWPRNYDYGNRDAFLDGTPFDHVFGWGEKGIQGTPSRNYPPVFPKLPIDYNTLVNDTTGVSHWGRKTIYILGKGGPTDYTGSRTTEDGGNNYALCQLQAGLTSSCSTHYNASSHGATMQALCEDESDPLQHSKTAEMNYTGSETYNSDWPNIAGSLAKSLSLSAGLSDNNASNARVLTQMIVTDGRYNAALPSMAEALAVLAGCTLIQSITDTPFVAKPWNYTLPVITPGHHQYFRASVRAQTYISGGTQDYQKGFYLVLFIVFFMNLLMLVYFLVHKDWYTDFSEPMNLFSLAVNSPPSDKLAGSCGRGPSGEQYRVSWKLNNDDGHFYYEAAPDEPVGADSSPGLRRRRWTESFEMMGSPIAAVKDRFSRSYN